MTRQALYSVTKCSYVWTLFYNFIDLPFFLFSPFL